MAILFTVILIDLIGFGIVIPILPFLSPQLGASHMDIALIVSCYAICAGLSGPSWGHLSDRIGRKPVIMMCLIGGASSYVMLGLATELWMVYAARAFAGLMAGNFGVATAMMADLTPEEGRTKGMGLIGVAWGLGLILGPLLGGVLSGTDGSFTLPCVVAGVMSLLAVVAAWLLLPESLSSERREANRRYQGGGGGSVYRMLKQTGNRLLAFQFVLHNACVSSVTYIFPLWVGDLLDWGPRDVGLVFGVQGAIIVVMQGPLIGPMVNAVGELFLLRTAVAMFISGALIGVFAGNVYGILVTVFMAMTGATLCMPLLTSIASQRTPIGLRGYMLGTTNAAASWGRVAGPLVAGVNLALFGYPGAWTGVVATLVFYLAWAFAQRQISPEQIPGN